MYLKLLSIINSSFTYCEKNLLHKFIIFVVPCSFAKYFQCIRNQTCIRNNFRYSLIINVFAISFFIYQLFGQCVKLHTWGNWLYNFSFNSFQKIFIHIYVKLFNFDSFLYIKHFYNLHCICSSNNYRRKYINFCLKYLA